MACIVNSMVAHSTAGLACEAKSKATIPSAAVHSRNFLTSGALKKRFAAIRPCAAAAGNGQDGSVQQKEREAWPSRGRGPLLTRRRRESPLLMLDSWDPFSAGGLREMMDLVDQVFSADIAPQNQASASRAMRTPWDVIEDKETFYVRVDMPGFGKEDVKVSIEDGVLAITGERDSQGTEDERWAAKSYRNFNTRLALPDTVQLDKIKAELKNGVLYVDIPKIKPEERKQLIEVQVS